MKSFFTGRGIALIAALGFLCANANVSSADQPIAPAVTGPDYSVTYLNGYGALSIDLYEKYGASGSWTWVAGGGGTVNFTGKAAGDYYYITSEQFVYYDEYWFPYYYYWNSPETHVSVLGGPVPTPDSVATQSRYTYETRSGDIDGNGYSDVFVRRTSGGAAGNGTIDTVILQSLGNGSFSHVVPSAYQASIAQGWPILATELVLKDFNLDGFLDIVLKDLGNAIGGAFGQVIVASGTASLAPQRVVPMDAKYTKFGNEFGNFVENPNWYFDTAISNGSYWYQPVYTWVQQCIYYPYYDENGYYYDYYYCWWESYLVGYNLIVDYSSFDPDGIQAAGAIGAGADGWAVPDIAPGGNGRTFDQVLQRVFGVRFMRGQLDTPCGYALAYDYDTDIPCQYDVIGQILLGLLATLTERGDCRPLTLGEIAEGVNAGFTLIGANKVRVCNKGFLGFGRWSIMAPNGNVYVGPGNEILVWYEDYSPSVVNMSRLVHELFHVYQYRNNGCQVVCMTTKKLGSFFTGGYDYTPIDWTKTFWEHNMEQQASMVEDRYFMRRLPVGSRTFTDGDTILIGDLETIIPPL